MTYLSLLDDLSKGGVSEDDVAVPASIHWSVLSLFAMDIGSLSLWGIPEGNVWEYLGEALSGRFAAYLVQEVGEISAPV